MIARLAVLMALASAVACGPPDAAGPRPPAPDRNLSYRDDLELLEAHNGMRIAILPQPGTNLVEVDVRIRVGAGADPAGKAGLAHLVEHLTFQVAVRGDSPQTVAQVLGRASLANNAFTNLDSTHYMSQGLKESLPDLLAVELARLGADCTKLSPDLFDREREVVRNEIRQYTGNSSALERFALEAAYPDGHPYRRMVRGDDGQLAAINREDACAFLTTYYAPVNATLIVAGDTTVEEVKAILNRHLGDLPPRPAPARRPVPAVRLASRPLKRSLAIDEPTALAVFALPPSFDLDDVPASFVVDELAYKLHEASRKQDWVTDTAVGRLGGAHAPIMVAQVSVRDAAHLPRAVDLIDRQVQALRGALDKTEIHYIRERRRTALLQRAERLTSLAVLFGDYFQFEDKSSFVVGDLERLQGLTAESVERVAGDILAGRAIVLVEANPDAQLIETRASLTFSPRTHDSGDRDLNADPAEADQPLEAPVARASAQSVRSFSLDNGMRVHLHPAASLPLVDIRMVFNAGSAQDPAGKPGVAQLAAQLISYATDTFEQQRAVVEFVHYGGIVEWDVSPDTTEMRVTGVSMYLDGLVHGLSALVRNGTYPEARVAAARTSLAAELDKPDQGRGQRLEAVVQRALYGHGHPYARAAELSSAAVRSIGRGDLVRFKERFYIPGNASLVIGGRFDPELMEQHVRHAFAGWTSELTGTWGVDEPARAHAVVAGFDNRNEVQLQVMLAYPTAAGLDEDHAARLVLAEMLGDRVRVVRERLGATYGVQAEHDIRVGPGLLLVSGAIDAARGGEGLAAIRSGIDGLRRKDTDFARDFVLARRAVFRRLLADASDSTSLAAELSQMARHRKGADFFAELTGKVGRLKPDDVAALAARELAADRETLVVAGARAAVEAAFKAAGLPAPKFVR